jgi:hypothetical protein
MNSPFEIVRRLSNYELGERLGRGGVGEVFLATEVTSGKVVAIKVARLGVPGAEAIFRDEIRKASRLAHPNIVRCLSSGVSDDGCAFLVMELMEQGTLAECVELGRFRSLKETLALVLKLALAVQHAHEHTILHCDIKPENILFDERWEPHVSDFGIGQRLQEGEASEDSENDVWGGTRGWMSPEQARRRLSESSSPGERSLNVASDVFSLGILLYWLASGRLPFGCGMDYEQRVQYQDVAPVFSGRNRWLPLEWEAEAICRRALAKDRNARYSTAAAFAADVQHALSGLPLSCEVNPLLVTAKWFSRHRVLAAAALALGLFLVYVPFVPFLMRTETTQLVLERNQNAALFQAGAILNELRALGEEVHRLSTDPEVIALVNHKHVLLPAPPLLRAVSPGVDNILVLDEVGEFRARAPTPTALPDRMNYEFRDYFQGAVRLGELSPSESYVARAKRSRVTQLVEHDVSAPLMLAGAVVGSISVARQVKDSFGDVTMACTGAPACHTLLLGPRDHDLPEEPLPDTIHVIAAHGLKRGEELALRRELSQMICNKLGCVPAQSNVYAGGGRSFADVFRDPLTGDESLGGFASIGRTGMVVGVVTPLHSVDALPLKLLKTAAQGLGLPLGAAAVTMLVLHWFLRFRRRAGLD